MHYMSLHASHDANVAQAGRRVRRTCLGMARAEGPSGHQLKIRHPSQSTVGVRDSDEWGLIESR
jgi:hypothetical protein